ncbi:ARID DNA-binding domain [Trinorchestia longiramus]|nr:ARID DNA-binding domain [Trinorchestia longiramus]
MSQDNTSETEAYDKEYDAFLKKLSEFHQQRGTSFKKLPRINGKGVDLYLLYVVVTARDSRELVQQQTSKAVADYKLFERFRFAFFSTNVAGRPTTSTRKRSTLLGMSLSSSSSSWPGSCSLAINSLAAVTLTPSCYLLPLHTSHSWGPTSTAHLSPSVAFPLLHTSSLSLSLSSLCSLAGSHQHQRFHDSEMVVREVPHKALI